MTNLALPPPSLGSNLSLAQALRDRRTTRELRSDPLPLRVLSNLLFAACGVNRRSGPFEGVGLTAASASNSQEIELFVALADGAYRFDPSRHLLVRVTPEDVRRSALGPHQPPISPDAPAQLVLVADLDRLEHTTGFEEPGLHDPEVHKSYYFVDAGIIAENVYLFAAAERLGCWFHHCDRAALSDKLRLRRRERVLFAQSIGYPR